MQVLPLALVLASAALHAAWNAILKAEARPELASMVAAALAAATSAIVACFMPGAAFPDPVALLWGVGAGLGEAGYLITLSLAFRLSPLALAYPMSRGGAILLVWPLSVVWLGEAATGVHVLGAIAVLGGLLLLAFDGRTRTDARGVPWALACAACIATYHLCDKHALGLGAEPAALSALSLSVSLPVMALRLGRRRLGEALELLRARPVRLASTGVLAAASFFAFLVALRTSGAAAILTLRNTSVLFAVGLAFALGERPRRPAIVAAALVAVGAMLVGWPAR